MLAKALQDIPCFALSEDRSKTFLSFRVWGIVAECVRPSYLSAVTITTLTPFSFPLRRLARSPSLEKPACTTAEEMRGMLVEKTSPDPGRWYDVAEV